MPLGESLPLEGAEKAACGSRWLLAKDCLAALDLMPLSNPWFVFQPEVGEKVAGGGDGVAIGNHRTSNAHYVSLHGAPEEREKQPLEPTGLITIADASRAPPGRSEKPIMIAYGSGGSRSLRSLHHRLFSLPLPGAKLCLAALNLD